MQHSHKFMEQMDASKVRETSMIKGDFYVFWRSTHSKPHLTVSDVRLKVP